MRRRARALSPQRSPADRVMFYSASGGIFAPQNPEIWGSKDNFLLTAHSGYDGALADCGLLQLPKKGV